MNQNSRAGNANGMFGRRHSEESKRAISEKAKQRFCTPEARARLAQQAKAAWQDPEVRKAITDSAKTRVGDRNSFFGKEHTDETKSRIAAANTGRFRGENGSNWKGGKTSLTASIRNSEPAVMWRKLVFERDCFTCQQCSRVGGQLQADHIRPLALLLDEFDIKTLDDAFNCWLLWDLSNGRTLCIECHKKTSSFAGAYQKNYKNWRARP